MLNHNHDNHQASEKIYSSNTIIYSWKYQKCSGDCKSFLELEKCRAISPSPWTNSDFPTDIVCWSMVTLYNLYYFIRRFSGIRIFFSYQCLSVPEYVSVEQVKNASTESVKNYLHFNIFFVFIMSLPLGDGGIQFFRLFVKKWFLCNNIKTPQHNHFKITCLEML